MFTCPQFKASHVLLVVYALFMVCVGFFGWRAYVPYRDFQNGFIQGAAFDCPDDHPIKANRNSMIYHKPFGRYYDRTDAENGDCFDTAEHAENQGFRAPFNE